MITLVLSLLVYSHYALRRFSGKLLLSCGLLAAVAASILGLLRAIPPEALASRQTIEFVLDHPPSELFYAFLESGEPAGDFESFPFLIQQTSSGMSFQWGETYFEAPLILVPRILYSSRPLTASQWYTDKFFPEVAKGLGGRPLFFLGEAYLNFGVFGPPVFMLLVGLSCRGLYVYLQRNRSKPEAALIYAAVVGTFPSAIRIDFATTLKVSLGSTLLVVLLVLWCAHAYRSPVLQGRSGSAGMC